jgi:hypothetical protein
MANVEKSATSARTQNRVRSILRPLTAHRQPDWRKFHAVVFESDDWGLCGEGKDKATHDRLVSLGYNMYSRRNLRLYGNTLETGEDLDRLFKTLASFEDSIGRHPVFTANFIVANPSFSEIRRSGFKEYRAVPITLGFPGTWRSRNTSVEAWHRGIRGRLIVPEYHGYSHFNYSSWLQGLRRGDKKLNDFFEEEMYATSKENPTVAEYGVAMPPYHWYSNERVKYQSFEQQFSNIVKGMEIFRATFSRYPRSTIPPHDISNSRSWVAFAKAGVGLLQSDRRKVSAMLGLNPLAPRTVIEALTRILLQLTVITRVYRNVRLENEEPDGTQTLELSNRIFSIGSPVIVGTHRQNYVGRVDPHAADLGIRKLEGYLKGLREDPNIYFLSSHEAFQLASRGHSLEKFGNELLIRNYTRGDLNLFVAVGPRHRFKDLSRGNASGIRRRLLANGARFHVPAGRTVAITEEE